jgi:hypothetical protein
MSAEESKHKEGCSRASRNGKPALPLRTFWFDDEQLKELACRAAFQLTITIVVVLDVQSLQLQGCNPSPATSLFVYLQKKP